METNLRLPLQINHIKPSILKYPPFFSPQYQIFIRPTFNSSSNFCSCSSNCVRIAKTGTLKPRINGKIRSSIRRRASEINGELGKVEDIEEEKNVQQVKRAYPYHEIEPKWQKYWDDNKTFRTPDDVDTSKPKFYVLDMFPYPRFVSSSLLIIDIS